MVVCQWWHWMKQASLDSLGADQHWDLVKWSLVTLCSTGEVEPPLTPLAQCLALVQPHTPSPTSILVQCMKWELHQWALLDWVDTAVGVGRKWQLTTVSDEQCTCSTNCLPVIVVHYFTWQEQIASTVIGTAQFVAELWCQFFFHELWYCNSVAVGSHKTWCPVKSLLFLSNLHHFLQQMYFHLHLEVC